MRIFMKQEFKSLKRNSLKSACIAINFMENGITKFLQEIDYVILLQFQNAFPCHFQVVCSLHQVEQYVPLLPSLRILCRLTKRFSRKRQCAMSACNRVVRRRGFMRPLPGRLQAIVSVPFPCLVCSLNRYVPRNSSEFRRSCCRHQNCTDSYQS